MVVSEGLKVLDGFSILSNRYFVANHSILCTKNSGTEALRLKAQWIFQWHPDKYEHKIANDSSLLMRMKYRVTTPISATFFGCFIWTRKVEQAYLQSKPLQRDVNTPPPKEVKLPTSKLLKIELPRYGLVHSSTCFFETCY